MHAATCAPLLLALALTASNVTAANLPGPVAVTGPGVTGTVVRYAAMPSAHVAARNVDVWLPPGYGQDPDKRYPVLYMHDGQNLFDPALSNTGIPWGVAVPGKARSFLVGAHIGF